MSEVNATKIKMERFKYYHGGYRKMSAGMRAERGLNDTTKQGWRDLPRQVAQTVGTRHTVSNAWARTVAEVQLTGEAGGETADRGEARKEIWGQAMDLHL